MFKKIFLGLAVSLSVFGLTQAKFTDQSNIPSWGNQAVNALVTAEIINGNADGSLAPWRSINRVEFLKILISATGAEIVTSSGKSFPDVPVNAWFSPYVHTAVSLGWAKGYPDGTFKPGNLINRAEIAKLVSEAWSLPLVINATDAHWYSIYVRALKDADRLPYATTSVNFDPGKNPSRIEVFEQLYRTWESAQIEAEVVLIPAIEEEILAPPETTTDEEGGEEEDTDTGEDDTENNDDSENDSEDDQSGGSGDDSGGEDSGDDNDDENEDQGPPPPPVDETELQITNLSSTETQIIYPGQGGITAFSAELIPVNGSPLLHSLIFSHDGNAPVSNFSRMWINDNNARISAEIIPNGGSNVLEFEPPLLLESPKEIFLKLDTPSEAEDGYTSRWVLNTSSFESTTDVSQIDFPVSGQWMNIHPE